MQSTTRTRTLTKHITLGALLISALAFAGVAEAGDRVDRRIDRRAKVIDAHLDALAFVAALSGEYLLAHELDRAGDRIERRSDRLAHRPHRDGHAAHRHARIDPHRKFARGDHKHPRKAHRKWQRKHDARKSKRGPHKHLERDARAEHQADRGHLDAFALRTHLGHR